MEPRIPLYFLYVKIRPHWGFVSRLIPFSKSRPAMDFIPPTTMIGALSHALTGILGLCSENIFIDGVEVSRAEIFRSMFKSLHATRLKGGLYSDLQKVYFFDRRRRIAKSDAVALEKMYVYDEVDLVYLIDPIIAEEFLGDEWQKTMRIAAWGITRIGQKECIVSAEYVDFGVAEPYENEIKTIDNYYFMTRYALPIRGHYQLREIIDWTSTPIGEYRKAKRTMLCIPEGEVEVELTKEGMFYKISTHGYVIGPRMPEKVSKY